MRFTFSAIMTRFYDDTVVRPIDIPKEAFKGKTMGEWKELCFHYGQNEIQNRKICSVSRGDVIHIHDADAPQYPLGSMWDVELGETFYFSDSYYLVEFSGFKELSRRQVKALGDKAREDVNNLMEVDRFHRINDSLEVIEHEPVW